MRRQADGSRRREPDGATTSSPCEPDRMLLLAPDVREWLRSRASHRTAPAPGTGDPHKRQMKQVDAPPPPHDFGAGGEAAAQRPRVGVRAARGARTVDGRIARPARRGRESLPDRLSLLRVGSWIAPANPPAGTYTLPVIFGDRVRVVATPRSVSSVFMRKGAGDGFLPGAVATSTWILERTPSRSSFGSAHMSGQPAPSGSLEGRRA